MSKTTRTLVLRASASLPAGTETGGWVRVPADARIIKVKLNHGALGGFHLDAKLQWATVPTGVVFDGITYAQDAADGLESAETDAFLTFVRYVVTATGGAIPGVVVTLELTAHPFAPTDYNFDLRAKALADITSGADASPVNTAWRRIPKEVLAFLAIIDADATHVGTNNVKLQHADDALGTNSADLGSGAFTQVTNGAALKEVKGPFVTFKDFVRAVATFAGAAVAATLGIDPAGVNNFLDYTAVTAGETANGITIQYLDPGAINQAISVTVVGLAIVVHLATNGAGAITSTAAQVKTAIDAFGAAHALVTLANHAGNDGSGVVTAIAATPLAGGLDVADSYGVRIVAR